MINDNKIFNLKKIKQIYRKKDIYNVPLYRFVIMVFDLCM